MNRVAMEPPDDLSDSEYSRVTPQTATSNKPPPPPLKQSTLGFDHQSPSDYLPRLNPQQRDAVTASHEGALAVHAGPGSGKTAVLTTRVAHLVQVARIPPEHLVVVTFTNKAANEMKVRLAKIVGHHTVDKVVMGTFHSCASSLSFHRLSLSLSLAQADPHPRLRRCAASASAVRLLDSLVRPSTNERS